MKTLEFRLMTALAAAAAITAAGAFLTLRVNPHALLSFLAFEFSVILGLAVLIKAPDRRIARLFMLLCCCIASYSLTLLGQYVLGDSESVRIFTLVFGAGFFFISAAGVHFSFCFAGLDSGRHRIAIPVFYALSGFFYVLAVFGFYELEYHDTGVKLSMRITPFYIAHLTCHAVALAYLIIELAIKYLTMPSGLEKLRTGIFLSASIATVALAFTNPLAATNLSAYPMAGPALAFLTAVLAYLIVKHRFLDVQFVLRRTFFWVLWTFSVASVYAVALACFGLLGYSGTFETGAWNFAAMLVAAVSLLPLRNAVQDLVDRRFFRRSYDARKTIERLSGRVIEILNVQGLSMEVLETVVSTFSAERGFIFLKGNSDSFSLAALEEHDWGFSFFPEDSRDVEIEAGEWCRAPRRFEPFAAAKSDLPPDCAEFVRARRIEACLPLPSGDGIAGLLMMGAKKSETAYTDEDMHLLSTIANQASVAFSNANFYEQVLAAKNYTEDVIESMEAGLLTVDRDCRLIRANDFARSLLGAVPGDEWACIGGYGHGKMILKMLGAVLSGGQGATAEEIRVKDSVLSLSTSAIRDHRGKIVGALASFQDVTERERMKSALERRNQLAMIGEMASRIAHEIKNPLYSILTRVGQIGSRMNDPAFMRQFQESVPGEIRRLESITDGLLKYSKPLDPMPGRVEPQRIVNSAISALSGELDAKGVALERRVREDLPPLIMDGELFKQVVINLVKNASEAVEESPGKGVSVSLEPGQAGGIVLLVADSGPGISADDLPRIFNPYYSTKAGGTGLGLATVAKIVDVHNGRITVESQPGNGARFIVEIPADGLRHEGMQSIDD